MHDRRGVYDKCNHIGGTRLSEERNDAVVGVVKIDPIKTCVTVVLIPQGRFALISIIEMLNEPAQPVVARQFSEVPVETRVVIPFVLLAEFGAHKQQFFARMPIHPSQKHPDIGKLLPCVAWHFGQQRTFAVDDFIMAKHENEIL